MKERLMKNSKMLLALCCAAATISVGTVSGCGTQAAPSSAQQKADFAGDPNKIPDWLKAKTANAPTNMMQTQGRQPSKPAGSTQ